jgi:hypothetical protein
MADIRTCIDRILPSELFEEAAGRATEEDVANVPIVPLRPALGVAPPTPAEMAGITGKKWMNGRTLRVTFLDGDPAVQTKVEHYARLWEPHANISLDFGGAADADIRISFEEEGSWSYIGTDALTIDGGDPTMNFGWLTTASEDEEYERVVVHEFGHALACIHEHQNPVTNIPWDKEAVYAHYAGPPNNWSRAKVDQNLFRRYSKTITQFSEFDRESIMLYPIPNELTIGDFEVGFNRRLSDTDKDFIATMYPGRAKAEVEIAVDGGAVEASIGANAEEDTFRFEVVNGGLHTIETEGTTDVVVGLFGPDDDTAPAGADDDSGQDRNARIEASLSPGAYLLRVRHFSPARTGDYRISVRSAAA